MKSYQYMHSLDVRKFPNKKLVSCEYYILVSIHEVFFINIFNILFKFSIKVFIFCIIRIPMGILINTKINILWLILYCKSNFLDSIWGRNLQFLNLWEYPHHTIFNFDMKKSGFE